VGKRDIVGSVDMRERKGLEWQPPDDWLRITVVDSHTGGEPFRLVVDGLPDIVGATILERRRYARENLDWLRKTLMWEPRGHADMYGGWMVPPETPDGDIGILFTHNEGFSTMCGHGIIALAKISLETGILEAKDEEATLRIDTPAGRVLSTSTIEDGLVTCTSFENVPSFVTTLDSAVETEDFGPVSYDLAFGGAFYAFVDAPGIGLDLGEASDLAVAGRKIKTAIMESTVIEHPHTPELGFLYGVIFTGPPSSPGNHSRNVCIFADGEVDRSPTGTGVSARLAILHARGELGIGDEVTIESIVGSTFTGAVSRTERLGDRTAVIPLVSGSAHMTGRAEMWIDPDDTLGRGFLLR
jgi:proline racemase